MSLLGFDAIGRTALGGAARSSATNTIFAAGGGSCGLAGVSSSFRLQFAASQLALVWSGAGQGFRTAIPGAGGFYDVLGKAISTPISLSAAAGALGLTGRSASTTAKMASFGTAYVASGDAAQCHVAISVQGGAYVIPGADAEFIRGFDNWFTLPRDSDDWTGRFDPPIAWLPAPMQTADWSNGSSADMLWTERTNPSSTWTRSEPTKQAD
jgi:hypothetical protein